VLIESLPFHDDITSVFRHFAETTHAVLFDSGKPGQQQGRYDILSAWPQASVTINNGQIIHTDTDKNNHLLADLQALKKLLLQHSGETSGELPFYAGWIGFASYELGYLLEPAIGENKHSGKLPAFWAGYYSWAIVQDHEKQQAFLVYEDNIDKSLLGKIHRQLKSLIEYPTFALTSSFQKNWLFSEYEKAFHQVQNYINAGDCYQVNIAMQYQATFTGSAFGAYRQLRKTVPSPHMAYLNLGDKQLLSMSPERFIAAQHSHIETRPIKGTTARLIDPTEDQIAARALVQSSKNRAENLMIVDLLRNDLGRHCITGSINVDALFALESYNNVHHLVSSISGTLKNDSSIWDVFFDSFPGGSITGAPKIRACQIIHELENFPRDIYCGSIFYAGNNGHFDSNIAIRTLLCSNGNITAWAGGGIVKDSTAQDEYEECQSKITSLLDSLGNQK
jgi:para-aminobenzoate synthetase component I